MVRTQFNVNINHVPFNNGQEFLSHATQKRFTDHGVLHERTCVKTYQQNRVVKRKHRHILEVAHCF